MTDSPRIVIIGGGFAGVFTARYLRRLCPADTHIELIDDKNYFVFQPLLPEVASGNINGQDAVTPQRALLGTKIRFRLAEAKRIDFEHKQVQVTQGRRHRLIDVPWDHLVITAGTAPALTMTGFAEHSLTMHNLSDAFALRNHVLRCLEWADVTENPDLKRRALTFIVVGGGFSGVETIGELATMVSRARHYYPRVRADEIQCILIHRGKRILPELPKRLGDYAVKELRRRGVRVMLETSLRGAYADYVQTESETIPTATLVSTIGKQAVPLLADLKVLERGRLPTDRMLRLRGFDNVWALGDAALIPLEDDDRKEETGEKSAEGQMAFAPPTAQFAVREAKLVAYNIAASLRGKPLRRFSYRSRGMMASLGSYRGVAEIFGMQISGVLAWGIWRAFYILMLPGFVTRLRVALNWLLDYFVPRTIVEVQQNSKPSARFACFRTGDILFRRGEILDGWYLVLEGCLQVSVPDPQGGPDFVKTAGPQEHIGDRIRTFDTEVKGDVIAMEDTRVMIIPWQDLVSMRESFTMFDNYLLQAGKEKYPDRFYKSAVEEH